MYYHTFGHKYKGILQCTLLLKLPPNINKCEHTSEPLFSFLCLERASASRARVLVRLQRDNASASSARVLVRLQRDNASKRQDCGNQCPHIPRAPPVEYKPCAC